MGNCCGGEEDSGGSSSGRPQKAFQGQGHRLGTGEEARLNATPSSPLSGGMDRDDDDDRNLPEPTYNPNLTNADREEQRQQRLAAIEARSKNKKTKKTKPSSEPLRGPNSQPLMRWNVAS
uniref:Uncharacterized protein n=1 Tax=Cyclophora tenuis TaxID=216820 RepID=A0A7S1D1N2_CYCTE|mmetsp:Transcript_16850/g.28596  ORF Transcript_16850/g.28596 Transcript_16850/m.28596 type:complete len:120 (+) Transcript_16850:196-555(+)